MGVRFSLVGPFKLERGNMIPKEKLEEWRTKINHWNIRDNAGKIKAVLLEVLDAIDEANTTNVQAPDKVRRNSKKKP